MAKDYNVFMICRMISVKYNNNAHLPQTVPHPYHEE